MVRVAPVAVAGRRLRDQGPRLAGGRGAGAGHGRGGGRRGRRALPRGRPRGHAARCWPASTPTATALEAERGGGDLPQGPGRRAARAACRPASGARRWRAEQLVAAEELNRVARRDRAPGRGVARRPRPPATSPRQNLRAVRACGRRAPASSTPRTVETGQFVQHRHRAGHARGHEPPAPALQGRRRRESLRARSRQTVQLPGGRAGRRATSTRPIYHVGDVADPGHAPGRGAWPG